MSKNFFIFFLLNFFVVGNLFAQKEDRNWVFGDSVGIDFNNLTSPSVFFTHSSINEACATISDKNGNILFYNGTQTVVGPFPLGKLFNKYEEVIENGDSLYQYFSATNGDVILPKPGDTSLYYFFHLSLYSFTSTNLSSQESLYYTIINKDSNGGHAKVISKNNFILDSLTEKICCIKHANGRDWWVIAHYKN